VVQATLFIPVMTTKTDNLKNTASISVQFYVGQGLSFIGNGLDTDNTWFRYDSPGWRFAPGTATPVFEAVYRRHLTRKYGGYIQGQYYINNQWYVGYVYGFAKPYGVTQSKNLGLAAVDPLNVEGYEYASLTDQTQMWQEHQINLFFSPSKALKFGLAYDYVKTDYFQITTVGSRRTRTGDNHSVRFGSWFYF
jgi:hypothetical protein